MSINREEIFKDVDEDLVVSFDANDRSDLPIEVKGDVWLSSEDATKMARAVLNKLSSGEAAVSAGAISFNEGLLRLAAVHKKAVTFNYAKGDGAIIETRTLIPSEVKEVKGHTLFIGFDTDRQEPRAYRVDRMKGEVSVA